MRRKYLTKKRLQADILDMKRAPLLDIIDETVWDYVIPVYPTNKGVLTLKDAAKDRETYVFTVKEWIDRVSDEIVSLDLKLTKKYFPELY